MILYPSDKGNNWPPLRTMHERKLLITNRKKKMMMRTANQARRNGESPVVTRKESIIKNVSKMRIVMIPFSNCVPMVVSVLSEIAQLIQIVQPDPNVTLQLTSVEVIHFLLKRKA